MTKLISNYLFIKPFKMYLWDFIFFKILPERQWYYMHEILNPCGPYHFDLTIFTIPVMPYDFRVDTETKLMLYKYLNVMVTVEPTVFFQFVHASCYTVLAYFGILILDGIFTAIYRGH